MKVRVPMMIQDEFTSEYKGMRLVEWTTIDGEQFLLDGPVTKRIAVLDFDLATGRLLPGVVFLPPQGGRDYGEYSIVDQNNIYSNDFINASVFATVLKTMYMFEEPDNLGRPLTWAFDAPQLLVIPRAGEWANAYYERASHSLQFFHFPNRREQGKIVYTSLSRDIIAHETAHAILDGIVPHLYDAITPQSLALHEGIADLSALLMAFRSNELRQTVLDQTGGSIEKSTAFNSLAEEFGHALEASGRWGYLRNLLNRKTLCPDDKTLDPKGKPNRVPRAEPHELSEVITGALYAVMVKMHTALRRELAQKEKKSEFSVSGKALYVSGERFKRMTLRAMDYLPPGEVSFADYGRAIIASDQASHPGDTQERNWIIDEFVNRCIVPNRESLQVETNFSSSEIEDIDLPSLVASDWYAYEFAEKHRNFLSIPGGVPFQVEPRLDVSKKYYHRGGDTPLVRECIFKVWWNQTEPNHLGRRYPGQRQMTVGTTLAIDWETHRVWAVLTSDKSKHQEEGEKQQQDRDHMLKKLVDQDLLRVGRYALGPDGHELRSVIRADVARDVMQVHSMAKMLHITGEV
jgi:hypothetical protein